MARLPRVFDVNEIARGGEAYLRTEEQTLTLDVTVTFSWWARVCFAIGVWLIRIAGTRGITGECAKKEFPLFKSAV